MGRHGVNDSENPVNSNASAEKPKSDASEWREYGVFLLKLAAMVLIFRSFIFSPFFIPSESMQPRLLIGDYLLVAKWPYGVSQYSLPLQLPLFKGRVLGGYPEPGDVVVFKKPPQNKDDYIKRAIAMPGDVVQMRAGVLEINGKPIKKVRLPDFVTPVTQGMRDAVALEGGLYACYRPEFEEDAKGGGRQCRYRHFRETLPNGRSYEILDIADAEKGDDTEPLVVPDGHVFFMGDNRDRSADSRFPATGVAIGMVPVENILGRAQFVWFSTDGTARWLLPWTWFSAARWDRMGKGI
jgi:signal peptidase I